MCITSDYNQIFPKSYSFFMVSKYISRNFTKTLKNFDIAFRFHIVEVLVFQTLISHPFDVYSRPKAFGLTLEDQDRGSDLFKSHVIARETKRLQRDFAYKDEKSREISRERRKRKRTRNRERKREGAGEGERVSKA